MCILAHCDPWEECIWEEKEDWYKGHIMRVNDQEKPKNNAIELQTVDPKKMDSGDADNNDPFKDPGTTSKLADASKDLNKLLNVLDDAKKSIQANPEIVVQHSDLSGTTTEGQLHSPGAVVGITIAVLIAIVALVYAGIKVVAKRKASYKQLGDQEARAGGGGFNSNSVHSPLTKGYAGYD